MRVSRGGVHLNLHLHIRIIDAALIPGLPNRSQRTTPVTFSDRSFSFLTAQHVHQQRDEIDHPDARSISSLSRVHDRVCGITQTRTLTQTAYSSHRSLNYRNQEISLTTIRPARIWVSAVIATPTGVRPGRNPPTS
jgi:hypothetical protein